MAAKREPVKGDGQSLLNLFYRPARAKTDALSALDAFFLIDDRKRILVLLRYRPLGTYRDGWTPVILRTSALIDDHGHLIILPLFSNTAVSIQK